MIIAIDTETYEFSEKDGKYKPVLNARKFVLGCAITDEGQEKFFTEHTEMRDWLLYKIEANIKRGKRTFIYAHNHEYDWYAIFKDDLLNKDIQYICFNPFIAIYKQKGYFLDTMAFYRMSLATVGDILGFPKGRLPMEVERIEELEEYLKRDTEIVLKAVLDLKKKINTLGFNPRKLLTSGQLAITSFLTYCRRNELDKDFTRIVKTGEKEGKPLFRREIIKSKYSKYIREAFRGGMNQCFKIGKFEDVTLIDCNAEYGYIMTKMDFPNLQTEQYIEKPKVNMLKEYVKESIGVARVKIKSPKMNLPFLPIRFHKYTVYPSNTVMRGTWTFVELKKAIELGYKIIDVEYCVRWKKSKINPLKEFIEHIYDMEKKAKTKEEKIPLKLLRNNLYGKFAQYRNNKDYKMVNRFEVNDYVQKGYKPLSSIGDKYICIKENEGYDPSYTNPIISALITAHARIYLYEELTKVPYDDLLYCDTDSIAFKGKHLEKFKIGWGLGEWKIEGKGVAKFLGEKRYYIDDKPKISGLMKREASVEIIEKEKDVETTRMVGLATGLRNGNLNNVGSFERRVHEMKPHNKLMLILPEEIDEVKDWYNQSK